MRMQILGGLCCTKEHEAGAPGRLTESSVQDVLLAKGNSTYPQWANLCQKMTGVSTEGIPRWLLRLDHVKLLKMSFCLLLRDIDCASHYLIVDHDLTP